MNREAITNAKRVVIKIGSSSLTGSAGSELDPTAVQKVVDLAFSLKKRGAEVVVVSSGAIAAGLSPLGLKVRPKDLATQQAAASVGQGLLIAQYSEKFKAHGVISSQVLLTTEDVVRRSHYANAQQTLTKLLSLGVVPVINENDTVGTQEIRFGDNDRLAALVALLIDADLLVLVSDIDALYDAPPTQAGAKAILEVTDFAEIAAKYSLVIDNSSFYRMDPDVPLIVPQVNSDHLNNIKKNTLAIFPSRLHLKQKLIVAYQNCASLSFKY